MYKTSDGLKIEKTATVGQGFSYKFDKTGDWYAVYEAVTEQGIVPKTYEFSVVESNYIEIEQAETVVAFGSMVDTLSAKYIDGQNEYECSVKLRTPDGSEYVPAMTEEFNQIGEYVYTFVYEHNGIKMEKKKRIESTLAYDNLFSPSGSGFFSAKSNQSAPAYSQTANGVLIEGTFGDTIIYRNPIDLSALDSLTSVMEFQILDDSATREFQIMLTDNY